MVFGFSVFELVKSHLHTGVNVGSAGRLDGVDDSDYFRIVLLGGFFEGQESGGGAVENDETKSVFFLHDRDNIF